MSNKRALAIALCTYIIFRGKPMGYTKFFAKMLVIAGLFGAIACGGSPEIRPHENGEVEAMSRYLMSNDVSTLNPRERQELAGDLTDNPWLWRETKSYLITSQAVRTDAEKEMVSKNIPLVETAIAAEVERREQERAAAAAAKVVPEYTITKTNTDALISLQSTKAANEGFRFEEQPNNQRIADLSSQVQFGLEHSVSINQQKGEVAVNLMLQQQINALYGVVLNDIYLYSEKTHKGVLIDRFGGEEQDSKHFFRQVLERNTIYRVPLIFRFSAGQIPKKELTLNFTFEDKNYAFKRSLKPYLKVLAENTPSATEDTVTVRFNR